MAVSGVTPSLHRGGCSFVVLRKGCKLHRSKKFSGDLYFIEKKTSTSFSPKKGEKCSMEVGL